LLGGSSLLVVLVVGDVVLVSTVGGIGIGPVVLSVSRTVVCWTAGGTACTLAICGRLLLAIIVAAAIATTTTVVAVAALAIPTAATVTVLRWVLLESFVLLSDVGEEVFA
jgi:hypothetical protein